MAIPTFVTKPYEDDKMIYDVNLHQYILTYDYASEASGWGSDMINDLDGEENVEWYLKQVSNVVYNYIRSMKDSKFQNRLEYYLSHSERVRNDLMRLMVDIVIYNMQEGGMFMAYVTGVNLQEAQNITNIDIKTAVGILGDQLIRNHGFAEREFRYDFDVVESSEGLEW